jgi:TRAP-type C4-dicarboxylate transport system permease small subunit
MKLLITLMDRFLKAGTVTCIAGMIGVVLLQVYARMFMDQIPAWTEEASRLLFIYVVGFAAGPAIKEKAYVNVDTLFLMLSERARKYLELFIEIIMIVFNGILTYEAYQLLLTVKGQISAALLWPMELFYGGTFMMVLFITIYLLLNILDLLRDIRGRKAGATA